MEITKTLNFSLAFEQMCNFAVINEVFDNYEATKRLVLLCFILNKEINIINEKIVAQIISDRFGLLISENLIKSCINDLVKENSILHIDSTCYSHNHSSTLVNEYIRRIEYIHNIENNVKNKWLSDLQISDPTIDQDSAWSALKAYLLRAFRRHGVQTVSLLDPNTETAPEHDESLTSLLSEAVENNVEPRHHDVIRNEIYQFLSSQTHDENREEYIIHLANGSVSYFALSVDPSVSNKLRENLSPLTLYLDTNVLLSVIDFNEQTFHHPINELISAIKNILFLLS
ncbi:MAG: hypothetical protein HQL01_01565 [Nitrospirae bacterium]|nr:hypothetical protein [Nitrospirota bacterium]